MPMISQNWCSGLPNSVGSGTFMPNKPGDHRHRAEQRRNHRQQPRHVGETIRHAGQIRIENAGHAILEHDRVVGHPHELIVDVAEAVRHLLADQVEFAARQPADDVALGNRRCGAAW